MEKRRGGRPRSYRKQSPTAKFMMINKEYFGNGSKPNFMKIRMVNGYLQIANKS